MKNNLIYAKAAHVLWYMRRDQQFTWMSENNIRMW